jgi:hypothetical protein
MEEAQEKGQQRLRGGLGVKRGLDGWVKCRGSCGFEELKGSS